MEDTNILWAATAFHHCQADLVQSAKRLLRSTLLHTGQSGSAYQQPLFLHLDATAVPLTETSQPSSNEGRLATAATCHRSGLSSVA
jgi:hypothetical protein